MAFYDALSPKSRDNNFPPIYATTLLNPLKTLIAQSLALRGKGKTRPFAKCPPIFAGPFPLSRAVPPDPQGKPSPPHRPVLPSDLFASWATQPTLSLCPLASPSHPLSYGTFGPPRPLKVGTPNLIRGPLFRERRRSFARGPLTPSARPGSIHPLSGTLFLDHPLARPTRFAPALLPRRATPP